MTDPQRADGSPLVDVPNPVADLAIPRVADPAEITSLVLFVASADAGFSTGAEFVADGGDQLGPVL
jgi:3alpha(or 20beta)-hydroxysteroid dehydrogenase